MGTLRPDDLNVDMYAVVEGYRIPEVPARCSGADEYIEVVLRRDQIESLIPVGTVMQIKAVHLPYVACSIVFPGGSRNVHNIDTRTVVLNQVSPEYAHAFSANRTRRR